MAFVAIPDAILAIDLDDHAPVEVQSVSVRQPEKLRKPVDAVGLVDRTVERPADESSLRRGCHRWRPP
jgi:hypothetical protein